MKETKDHFIDWYSDVFPYGYGTGDVFYCRALKQFFGLVNHEYSYEKLEAELGAAEAWFLLNELGKADFIEYGTSPRYGWLTKKGHLAADFLETVSEDELYEMVNTDSDYVHCYKNYCNHTDLGKKGCRSNPFWFPEALSSNDGLEVQKGTLPHES